MKCLNGVGVLLVILAARQVVAQSPVRFDVTPRVGYYAGLNELGLAAPAGESWLLSLGRKEPTMSVEMSARLALPSPRLSARVLGLVALPSEAHGGFSCHPGAPCPAIALPADAQVTVLSAVADLMYAPFSREARARPFALLGAGVKRYNYSWSGSGALVQAGEHNESGLALHAGLGLELDVIGVPIRVEASDYWSPAGKVLASGRNGAPDARRGAQHDLSFTLGWRLLRF
jgi:hypothetical protein